MGKGCPSKFCLPYLSDIQLRYIANGQNNRDEIIVNGSLIFADLSGFTAMSEKLASVGRLGGEKLAEIINGCFNPLLDIVFSHNGDVIKFGGDAFLVFFSGQEHAKRAYACSACLVRWINEHGKINTPAGEFSLGIHIGISTGDIFNLCLGGDSGHNEHLFCGKTVEQTYAAADAADLGQIAITEQTLAVLGNIKVERTKDGFFVCLDLPETKNLQPISRQTPGLAENLIVNKYLITGLGEQLSYNNGIVEGEHRILTSLFIGVSSLRKNLELDLSNSSIAINKYFAEINKIIENHEGALARLDSSGTSEKMLIFFGAPKSSGQDSQNCLRAALAIEAILPELNKAFPSPVKHRYGINTGLCFVGDVGGTSRHEYTAMGDAINLAARLMGKSNYGQILVGEKTLNSAGKYFVARNGGRFTVKGKAQAVAAYYLESENKESRITEEMIGREAELKRGAEFIDRIKSRQPAFLTISGDPGAGKSLYCSKLINMAQAANLKLAEGACFKHSEKSPYEPLKTIILGLFGLSQHSTQKERRHALQTFLAAIGETEWEPMVAPLLDYSLTVPPELLNLPESIKRSKINDIICRLLLDINCRSISLIIVEDVQWIDDASHEIIKSLMAIETCPGIVFVSRPGEILNELAKMAFVESIELGGLTEANSRRLFVLTLAENIPSETIIKQVIEKSGGNPFYLEEMAKAFKELGPEKFGLEENIPSTIESVITARIDNLGETVKKTVRTASVIGRVFAYGVLQAIYTDRIRVKFLRQYLDELSQLDLTPLERQQPVLEYIFKHILTQEVAYNGLSFSSRQALHLKTAEYFAAKKQFCRRHPEIPARHYLLAGQEQTALPFLLAAAQNASSQFANNAAFEYYAKALEIAQKHDDSDYIIKILLGRGELAKQTSNYKMACEDYLKLKSICENNSHRIEALCRLSEIYRMTAEYDQAEVALNELQTLSSGSEEHQAFYLNGKGEIARRRGKLNDCRDHLLEALKLSNDKNIPRFLIAQIYNNLGICHWSLGRLNEAAEYYKKALTLFKKMKDLNGQSMVINNLGIISDKIGKLSHAAKAYEKAEKIFKRIGATRSQAFACANLGTNLTTRGYLAEAIRKLTEAKDMFGRIGDQHALAYSIGDLGAAYLAVGDLPIAHDHFMKALEMAQKLQDEEFILENSLRIYRLQILQSQTPNTEIFYLINKAKEVGSIELELKAKVLKSWQNMISGNLVSAKENTGNNEEMAQTKDYPEIEIELSKVTICNLYLNGSSAAALKIFKNLLAKAIRGDLALLAAELISIGQAFNLMKELPENQLSKVANLINRLQENVAEQDRQNYHSHQRRTVELAETVHAGSDSQKVLAKSNN
jgi:class 3 adenylate cyclase/tetratricopeptide (TPR) repeat protein